MKTGKEIKVTDYNNYTISYGSVNNKQPKAVFINIASWAEPKAGAETNYNRTIRDLRKKIKQNLFNLLLAENNQDFDRNKTIVDLDIRESGIKVGKRSFMNCEITLFLNHEIPLTSNILRIDLDRFCEDIITTSFKQNKTFTFYKKKK